MRSLAAMMRTAVLGELPGVSGAGMLICADPTALTPNKVPTTIAVRIVFM